MLSQRFLSCSECQGERNIRCSTCSPAIAAVFERQRIAEQQEDEPDVMNLAETEARGKKVYQRAVVRGGDLEWLLHTLRYLDTSSLLTFVGISRYLVAILSCDEIWKILFVEKFPNVRTDRALLPRSSRFWYNCYRMEYTYRESYPSCDTFYSLYQRFRGTNIIRWTESDLPDMNRYTTIYHLPPIFHQIWDTLETIHTDAGIPHSEIYTMHHHLYHIHPTDSYSLYRSIYFNPDMITHHLNQYGHWMKYQREKLDGKIDMKKRNDDAAWSMLMSGIHEIQLEMNNAMEHHTATTDVSRNMKRHCLLTMIQSIAKKRIITHFHQSKRQNVMEQICIYVHDTAIRILSSRSDVTYTNLRLYAHSPSTTATTTLNHRIQAKAAREREKVERQRMHMERAAEARQKREAKRMKKEEAFKKKHIHKINRRRHKEKLAVAAETATVAEQVPDEEWEQDWESEEEREDGKQDEDEEEDEEEDGEGGEEVENTEENSDDEIRKTQERLWWEAKKRANGGKTKPPPESDTAAHVKSAGSRSPAMIVRPFMSMSMRDTAGDAKDETDVKDEKDEKDEKDATEVENESNVEIEEEQEKPKVIPPLTDKDRARVGDTLYLTAEMLAHNEFSSIREMCMTYGILQFDRHHTIQQSHQTIILHLADIAQGKINVKVIPCTKPHRYNEWEERRWETRWDAHAEIDECVALEMDGVHHTAYTDAPIHVWTIRSDTKDVHVGSRSPAASTRTMIDTTTSSK